MFFVYLLFLVVFSSYCMFLLCIDLVGWIVYFVCFFFFKQKTAYEMRISDWSSDVCSSDLGADPVDVPCDRAPARRPADRRAGICLRQDRQAVPAAEIGRASCRERVCQYV